MKRGAGVITSVSLVLLGLAAPAAVGKRIAVTTTADEFGGAGSTGCAMREAVQSANTNQNFGGCKRKGSGPVDVIKPEGGQLYQDARAGSDDTNENGDLDITGKTAIEVRGEDRATLNGNDLDRVLDVHSGATLEASRLVVEEGAAVGDGGGIFTSGRTALRSVDVRLNQAGMDGGGIAAVGGRLVLRNSEVAGNGTTFRGGGILIAGTKSASISRSTISDNESMGAFEGGGGMMVSADGPTALTNSTVSGNKANSRGGGINVFEGELRLNAVTVTNNTADHDGDGGGTAGGGGGGLNFITNGVSARVINSIVAGNHATNGEDADCGEIGQAQFPGHNLVGDGTGCPEAQNLVTADPLLEPLGENGGPTRTHALSDNSPAIDKASRKSSPSTDQRGVSRDRKPDIGAYER